MHVIRQSFDALDRRTRLQEPVSASETKTTRYQYVAGSSRLWSVTDPAGTVRTLSYFPSGRLMSEEVVDGARMQFPGQVTTRAFTYTPAGQIATASVTKSNDVIATTLDHDSLGNVLREWNSLAGDSFAVMHPDYDDLGRPLMTQLGSNSISRGYEALSRSLLKSEWRRIPNYAACFWASMPLSNRSSLARRAATSFFIPA